MSLRRNTIANLAGAIAPTFISIVTVPPYLHLIGPERYGVLAIVWIFLGYFGLFSMGLDRATANELARCGDDPGRRVTVFWTALFANGLFGTVGAVALGVAAGFMLGPVFKISAAMKPEVFAALPWLVASVPLATVTSVMIGALEARERFVTLNWLSLVGTFLFQLIPLAIAYWHGPDLGWLIASTILSRTLGTLMLLAACVRAVPLPAVRVDWSHVPTLLRYGGWVTVTGLIGPLLTTLDRFVIAATAGPAGVTYYTIPYNLATKALIVPGALTRALFPRFSAQTAADAAELSRKAVTSLSVLMTPIAVCGVLLMRPFLTLWVGPEIAARSSIVGEILVAGVWFNALAYVPFCRLQAQGRPDIAAKFHAAEILPFIGVLWLGLHFWGVEGAAAAWALRTAVDMFLFFIAAQSLGVVARSLALGMGLIAVAVAASFIPFGSALYVSVAGAVLVATAAISFHNAPASMRDEIARIVARLSRTQPRPELSK